jgi:hypothetical protein
MLTNTLRVTLICDRIHPKGFILSHKERKEKHLHSVNPEEMKKWHLLLESIIIQTNMKEKLILRETISRGSFSIVTFFLNF